MAARGGSRGLVASAAGPGRGATSTLAGGGEQPPVDFIRRRPGYRWQCFFRPVGPDRPAGYRYDYELPLPGDDCPAGMGDLERTDHPGANHGSADGPGGCRADRGVNSDIFKEVHSYD